MKAKFSRTMACIEENEVNFAVGTLEQVLDVSAGLDLEYTDIDRKRELIKANIELLRASLSILESEVEHDYQNLLGFKLELENTPPLEEVDDIKLDHQEELKVMG